MSADDIIVTHLRTIAARTSWRKCELGPDLTEDVFRVLDERKWVEFRIWGRNRTTGVAEPLEGDAGWFSPRWKPSWAGDLRAVLNKNKDDPELSPELRVTEEGKAELARLAIRGGPPPTTAPTSMASTDGRAAKGAASEYDVFVCHASEDKTAVVRPLTSELLGRQLRVWVDYTELRVGDRLRARIDEGLRRSRFGIVVVSPRFFAKQWPQIELDGLVSLETADGKKRILPIWYEVEYAIVAERAPTLAGRLAAKWSDGLSHVADEIIRAVRG